MASGVYFISRTTDRFWFEFFKLPLSVQSLAVKAFHAWRENPRQSSLRFKRVHPQRPIYSVRIGQHWRAVATVEGRNVFWFWIGSHAEYDKLLRGL